MNLHLSNSVSGWDFFVIQGGRVVCGKLFNSNPLRLAFSIK